MNNRLSQNLFYLFLMGAQLLVFESIKRVGGLSMLRAPAGATLFMAVNLFAVSYLVPKERNFGRRLIRFSAVQCLLLFLLILLSGWHSKITLQEVINPLLLYVVGLLPIIVAQFYKD